MGMAGDQHWTVDPNWPASRASNCTGDCHAGNNTVATPTTWGLHFDGHANLAAIVDDLLATRGLDAATHVLFTGGSAGGVGVFRNGKVEIIANLVKENV